MFGLTRLRIVEIGVALLLTLAALLFVGLTVWAADLARVEVAGAWARPTVGQGQMSAAYMTIANKGDAGDMLKSARTPKAKAVELHQTTMTAEGVMQMRKVEDGLPVEAGGIARAGTRRRPFYAAWARGCSQSRRGAYSHARIRQCRRRGRGRPGQRERTGNKQREPLAASTSMRRFRRGQRRPFAVIKRYGHVAAIVEQLAGHLPRIDEN